MFAFVRNQLNQIDFIALMLGRGRPQRILLGVWPEEHIKGVVKTVVFRDDKDLREDTSIPIPEFDANTVSRHLLTFSLTD